MRIPCKKCGYENDLGRIFCSQCGNRLELNAPEVADAIRRGDRHFPLMGLISTLVALSIAAGVGLALWPRRELPAPIPADAVSMRVKFEGLYVMVRTPVEGRVSFTASEAAAYMDVRAGRRGERNLWVGLSRGRVVLREPGVLGPWALGKVQVGPIVFTREVEYAGGERGLRPVLGRVGHLPLPGPLKWLVVHQVQKGLSASPREQQILGRVRRVDVDETHIHISVGG